MDMFLEKVKTTITKYSLLRPGDCVVVAVSGGPDSVVLLHVLLELRREYGLRLFLAHLDHGLREESRDEARFVKGIAKALKMACCSQRADIIGFCRRKKLSLEEGAREVRYAFLEEAARKARASRIALGHTMDDQAETVMMRLIRGAGPRGLAGIPPVRGKIIRPLIGTRRNEIIRFLDQNRLPYLLDPSNRDPKFLRNRIRLLLIPLLEREFNPGIIRALARTGQLFTKEGVKEIRGQHGWGGDLRIRGVGKTTKLVLDLSKFLEYNKRLQREAVREAVKRIRGDLRGIGFIHTESILALVRCTFDKTIAAQLTISPEFTICNDCRKWTPRLQDHCDYCESKDVYGVTRIVGYFSRISNWNKSKLGELKDRHKGDYSVAEVFPPVRSAEIGTAAG